jgi:transglutaminase-like putative cysteine protease
MLEKDRQRQASRTSKGWLALVGIDEAAGVVAKAKAITNFVYQRSSIKGPPDRIFSHFDDARDWDTTPPPTVDGLCGTFTTAVLDLCGKFGIAARRASLATQRFAEGNAIGDTHELAEVFDPAEGGWVLFDPSFNLTFEGPDGRLLGLKDLLAEWRVAHDRSQPERVARFVDAVEKAISEEYGGWVTDWAATRQAQK